MLMLNYKPKVSLRFAIINSYETDFYDIQLLLIMYAFALVLFTAIYYATGILWVFLFAILLSTCAFGSIYWFILKSNIDRLKVYCVDNCIDNFITFIERNPHTRIYVSRKTYDAFKNHYVSIPRLYHVCEFIVDPYLKDYGYSLNRGNTLINSFDDL